MIVITDIDDVLSDSSWRKELLPDWDAFHANSVNDPPHPHLIELVNSLHRSGCVIWALTGRPEKWRRITNDWMLKHHVMVDNIVMRPDNNYQSSPEFKLSTILNMSTILNDQFIILDDRDDVCTTLSGAGYKVLQVRL